MSEQSAKPYLVRAICEWCADNGLTPYLAVKVNAQTRVPAAFVKNGEIVLNVSLNATRNLTINNELVQFCSCNTASYPGNCKLLCLAKRCVHLKDFLRGFAFDKCPGHIRVIPRFFTNRKKIDDNWFIGPEGAGTCHVGDRSIFPAGDNRILSGATVFQQHAVYCVFYVFCRQGLSIHVQDPFFHHSVPDQGGCMSHCRLCNSLDIFHAMDLGPGLFRPH